MHTEILMGVSQYARLRKVSDTAVKTALRHNKKLIGVNTYQKIGKYWLLNVCTPVAKINIGKCIEIP